MICDPFSMIVLSALALSRSEGQVNGVTFSGTRRHPSRNIVRRVQVFELLGLGFLPDGREYALIGAYDGLSIVDLNGDSLRELQFIRALHPSGTK